MKASLGQKVGQSRILLRDEGDALDEVLQQLALPLFQGHLVLVGSDGGGVPRHLIFAQNFRAVQSSDDEGEEYQRPIF